MTPEQAGLAIADRFMSGAYTGRDNLALHIASAIRQERERCAKIVESIRPPIGMHGYNDVAIKHIVAAIREDKA